MNVPNEALPHILRQRTGLQWLPGVWQRLDRYVPVYHAAVAIQSVIRRRRIKGRYAQRVQQDYEAIRTYLPQPCPSILDIGCGMSGIDVLLYQGLDPSPELYLLDRAQVAPRLTYYFRPSCEFYHSWDATCAMLRANAVPAAKIHLLEAGDTMAVNAPIHLVLSLASWGFHYPVATYLAEVKRILAPGGRIILDVRKGTEGMDLLKSQCRSVQTIHDGLKLIRVVCEMG